MEKPHAGPAGDYRILPNPSHDRRKTIWSIEDPIRQIRARLISGLLVTTPIVITFWLVYSLYVTLSRFVLYPLASVINRLQAWLRNYPTLQDFDLPPWWYNVASPILAIAIVLMTLYMLGLLVRTWVYRAVDWTLLHVPVVATIYKAVRSVVDSVGSQFQGGNSFKRVVLVEFPHPGMRSLALVTNTLHDATTGRTILAVCVLTGVVPPTGFTLYVPEDLVTNIAWNVNETLQSIVSGGLTSPPTIHYMTGVNPPRPAGGGPIVDALGNPVESD
jgi:uncharacterized membrane protein